MPAKSKKEIKKEIKLAPITMQPITETLRTNYMPYAMSSIISRAIPEIDGLKPSHRKLLYTMYKMGLLNGARVKSANIVGQTMKLNPHGDAAIYETMVRLTRGCESLLHPFIDSKGSFGKQYSKMQYAASRYTEAKLMPICNELFSGIDKDAVDFIDNYDASMKEPVLLPSSFPNILVCPNMGIAVGLASSICSFNLNEICDAVIAIIEDENADLYQIVKAPDFSTGGILLYERDEIEQIYETGKGSFAVRSVWNLEDNRIIITEIPYNTTVDQIIEKIVQLIKEGKLKEINDLRDETDIKGLRLAIDIKRGTDANKLMSKLFKQTDLECRFPCNFNILISGSPHQMGLKEILNEWLAFRTECLKREFYFDLSQKEDKLHLLQGLQNILLDIDKAIKIIRNTENEKDVVPNLMKGFSIDEKQAEFVAEIKLRHLNKEYILSRISEIEKLEKEIEELENLIKSPRKLNRYIINELNGIKKKYGQDRKTKIVYEYEEASAPSEEEKEYTSYAVITKEGYIKNIPLKSIMMNSDHKLKEDDEICFEGEMSSKNELMFFTDKGQAYKAKFSLFSSTKASELGDYIPAKLEMSSDEKVIYSLSTNDYSDDIIIIFKNGKGVRIPLSVYQTKGARKKLTGAISTASPAAAFFVIKKNETKEIFFKTKCGKAAVLKSSLIPEKTTRTSIGVQLIQLKKNDELAEVFELNDNNRDKLSIYKKLRIPTPGTVYNEFDMDSMQGKMNI